MATVRAKAAAVRARVARWKVRAPASRRANPSQKPKPRPRPRLKPKPRSALRARHPRPELKTVMDAKREILDLRAQIAKLDEEIVQRLDARAKISREIHNLNETEPSAD